MKQNIEKSLYNTGLDDKESEVYSYLLTSEGGTPTEIASKTKLNRSTAYKVLVRLAVKGLVGETKKGAKRYYFAENPNKLKKHIQSQVRNVERQLSYTEDLLPRLDDLYQSAQKTTQAFYYKGDEIRKIYDDHVSFSEYELLALANIDAIKEFSSDYSYWKTYIKQKVQNKITTRGIVSDSPGLKSITDQSYGAAPRWAQPVIKTLPLSFFSFEGEYIIYGEDRVSMINLKEGQVSGVIIVDKMFNQMMRNFFDLVWQSQP